MAAPMALPATASASAASDADIAEECTARPRCDVEPSEAQALGAEIADAQKAVLDSQFQDVHAIVRLAKLQLRRDAHDVPGPDGDTDAAQALKNAMRAVAVDEGSDEARVALLLALARSLHAMTTTRDPIVRGLALDLLGLGLHDVRSPDAAVLAKTLDHARGSTRSRLTLEALAPPPPPAPRCTAAEATAAPMYCKGLETPGEQGALQVVDGWRALEPLCEAQNPACPSHVSAGLMAASRAFLSSGRLAKSISTGMMILSRPNFPGAKALEPAVCLELGDRYYALGAFDQAASWYERAAKLHQGDTTAAASRALQIRVALGDPTAGTRLATELVHDARYPQSTRAAWAVMVAHLLRASRGPAEATAWLGQHDALLAHPLEGDAHEATLPLPAATTTTTCDPLACVVHRLAR